MKDTAEDQRLAVDPGTQPIHCTPRILLIATLPWMFSARLASALRKAGFHVEAVCRFGHPLRHLGCPIRIHRLGWLREVASVKKAIRRANPHFLVPCDDPSVRSLHILHRSDQGGNLASLIEKSLGSPIGYEVSEKRSALVELAQSIGLLTPRSRRISGRRALSQVDACHTFPCVLKRDETWSGIGVAIVESPDGLNSAWSWITGWISILRASKAVLRDRRPRTLIDALMRRGATVETQEFIAGTPANRAVLCREGK